MARVSVCIQVVAVAIDDQAGDAIGLGTDHAAKLGAESQAFPISQRLADAAGEKLQVEILAAARKAAGDDLRLRIVDRGAERAIAEILECDDIARLGIAEGFFDFSGVHPVVSVENACPWGDDETCHNGLIWKKAKDCS